MSSLNNELLKDVHINHLTFDEKYSLILMFKLQFMTM